MESLAKCGHNRRNMSDTRVKAVDLELGAFLNCFLYSSCHDYLVPLMQTDFIDTIYELTEKQHEMCSKCSQFQHIGQTILKKLFYLAESGVGKGDIAHKLFKGPWEMKQKLVLGIPLIIRCSVMQPTLHTFKSNILLF